MPAAVLRIPRQTFDSPEQIAFARMLMFNPLHSIPEHRPLGNVSRARKRMYYELAQLRQKMNNADHYRAHRRRNVSGLNRLAAYDGLALASKGTWRGSAGRGCRAGRSRRRRGR